MKKGVGLGGSKCLCMCKAKDERKIRAWERIIKHSGRVLFPPSHNHIQYNTNSSDVSNSHTHR